MLFSEDRKLGFLYSCFQSLICLFLFSLSSQDLFDSSGTTNIAFANSESIILIVDSRVTWLDTNEIGKFQVSNTYLSLNPNPGLCYRAS